MDKYEMNLKIEQIKRLAAKKAYKEAAAIAKDMSWHKVKDWSALATAINVQEAVGDYEEARDMAILAYNRNLGGRKLVYKLTELMIKLKQFDDADGLYEEYERMSQHDVSRYVLYYLLRKAEGASDNELVEILEDYKNQEIDEKYMYELAELYAKTGRRDECVKACDELALLFQDGVYVEKAMKLKQGLGAPLTTMQIKIIDDAQDREEKEEKTKEMLFEQQQELARIRQDDIEDALNEDAGKLEAASLEPETAAHDEVMPEESSIDSDESVLSETETAGAAKTASREPEASDALKTSEAAAETINSSRAESSSANQGESVFELANKAAHSSSTSKPGQMPESLKELIENAKKKIESSYDRMSRENEEERLTQERAEAERHIREREDAMEIEAVRVPNYNDIYDTQNIQAQLAQNLSSMLDDEQDPQIFRPNPVPVDSVSNGEGQQSAEDDEQIEGQLSLADWIESVRQQKYGNKDTKEYSKEELERMLDEKDEKSAAYEKLVEEQKALAQASGTEFNEEEARLEAKSRMMLHAAKTDLAIRTGKAVLKQEEAVSRMRQNNAGVQQELTATVEPEVLELNTKPEAAASKPEPESTKPEAAASKIEPEKAEPKSEPKSAKIEDTTEISLDTAEIVSISEEMLENIVKQELDTAASSEQEPESVSEAGVVGELAEEEKPRRIKPQKVKEEEPAVDDIEQAVDDNRKLSGDLAKIFRKYREMPGLESQLVEYFDTLDSEMSINNSSVGNILISGNSSSDKTDLARTIVRAVNHLYPDNPKKIAKTTGDSINHRGISKAMSKLRGTALIVEGAGAIHPKRISEIMECLKQDTDRMIVIFEDSDAEMNVLINFNPELTKMFNHRIVLKQYTVNELVEMARKFARKRQYEVDDDALLELYLKIDKLHSVTDNIRLDDIKEIINKAIAHSEKRASRRFFGGIKKKRSENGDIFFLSEADFKD